MFEAKSGKGGYLSVKWAFSKFKGDGLFALFIPAFFGEADVILR
jgi:hypothetical protein